MALHRCVLALHRGAIVAFIALATSGCAGCSKEQEQEMQRVRDMVNASPASVNLADRSGNTPLHLAAMNNYVPLMDWLKDHGANPNTRGLHGDTLLDLDNLTPSEKAARSPAVSYTNGARPVDTSEAVDILNAYLANATR